MTYLAPDNLEAALLALSDGSPQVVAGGTDVFPSGGERRLRGPFLDISRLSELRGIGCDGDGWRIGAATTWSDVANAKLPPGFLALQQAAAEVGARQIQNVATVAGNLCNASPAADGVPPLVVLDARVEIISQAGKRTLPVTEFVTGVRQTALAPNELVSAILIPPLPEGANSTFLKLGSRRYLVISVTMVAVLLTLDGGRIEAARICVGACSPVAKRLGELERALVDLPVENLRFPDLITPDHLAQLSPIDDVRADAEYRQEATAEIIRRALIAASGRGA